MPLRPDHKKKLNNSAEEQPRNSSHDSCYDTMDEGRSQQDYRKEDCSGDEEDPDQFLAQMGLETEVIKKINIAQVN